MGPWLIGLLSMLGAVTMMMCGLKCYFAYLERSRRIQYQNDIAYL